nr:hemagglutinin-neuraminidase [Avian paramyxovirus 14]
MEGSRTVIYQGDPNEKSTWRLVFRALTLILNIAILSVTIASIIITSKITLGEVTVLKNDGVEEVITPLMATLSDSIQQERMIYKEVAISIPLVLDKIQTDVGTSVAQITDALRQIQGVNGTQAFALSNAPEYSGGIEVPLFQIDSFVNKSMSISGLLEHASFIPSPTTLHGCTRIPSFHLGPRHWCYTHNIIGSGCRDEGFSSMYISMGAITVNRDGNPLFITTASTILVDDNNRKSCSIIASSYGCDVLCSIVTEREDADYANPQPTKMVHGRFLYNGSYVEQALPNSLFQNKWVAQYPGVGAGVTTHGKVLFPIYGGIKKNTQLFNELSKYGYFAHNRDLECRNMTEEQIRDIKAAYLPSKTSGNLFAQGIVHCNISKLGDCNIVVLNTSTTMMGAEGRLQMMGEYVYYYQRSSSWWPVGIVYKKSLADLLNGINMEVLSFEPIPLSKFPRPTWTAGLCQKPSICPDVCVTGVYTDLFSVAIGSTTDKDTYFGVYLDGVTERRDPWVAAADQYVWKNRVRLFKSTTEAAYTTSTCFKNTVSNRVFCVSIVELREHLLGDWRIVPLLFQIGVSQSPPPKGIINSTERLSALFSGDKNTANLLVPQH